MHRVSPPGDAAAGVAHSIQTTSRIRLCSVVLAELYYGAYRSADPPTNLKLVNELSETFISLAFDDRAAEACGQLRATLEATGSIIGPYDLQIAAIGLTRDWLSSAATSGNLREFPASLWKTG